MFKFIVVLAIIASAFGFNPIRFAAKSQIRMASEQSFSQKLGAALIASSLLAGPAFAVEGAGAKLEFFGGGTSSPFTVNENREDPIYSPYSPYGDGTAAVYNNRKGSAEEIKFWNAKFVESIKRIDKVPGFAAKKQWSDVDSTMRTYAYNLRESFLRLADTSSDPAGATAAAQTYFSDLNDISEFSIKKKGDLVVAAYQKSLTDLAAFKAYLK